MKHLRSAALLAGGLMALSAPALAQVVLERDNSTASFTGTWTAGTTPTYYYGSDFATAVAGGASDVAKFTLPGKIPATGKWCVQANWTAAANRAANATYQVYEGATLRGTFHADQRVNGGAWMQLGCVYLRAGYASEIRVSDAGVAVNQIVVADGVRWVWSAPVRQSYCIAVNGGWGSGGTTFVGQGFAYPAGGTCSPWNGFVKTASSVVGTSSGTACLSTDGKLFTAEIVSTAPEWLGIGVLATDHIELCPLNATAGCPAHAGQSDRGTFGSTPGTASAIACTAAIVDIPSSHD